MRGKRFFREAFSVFLMVVVALSMPIQSYALTQEQLEMFSQNNILFYDPGNNACFNEGIKNSIAVDPANIYISGDDNAGGVIGTLMNNGYSQQSAAAIVGNLQAESSLNPRILQGGSVVSEDFIAWENGGKTFNGGFGLAQWTSEGRVEKLQNYADQKGLKVTSIQVQVGFLIQELNEYGITFSELNKMNLEEATFHIYRNYEKPASVIYDRNNGVDNDYAPSKLSEVSETATPAAYKELNKRYKFAQQFLGITPTDLPKSVIDSNGNYVNCISYSGDGTPITVDGVISFLQCDPVWGELRYGSEGVYGSTGSTICKAGCGPTSFASIAATLGLQVDPIMTADVAGKAGMYVTGSGSSWAHTKLLAEEFGLQYEKLDNGSVENISGLLRNGKMIHVAGAGSMPFTKGGHYVAIVGITDSGEWIVADSGHTSKDAVKAYNPQTILDGMRLGSAGVVWR